MCLSVLVYYDLMCLRLQRFLDQFSILLKELDENYEIEVTNSKWPQTRTVGNIEVS